MTDLTRRGLLGSILALAAAPAIVKAQNIMPIWVPKDNSLLLPELNIALTGLNASVNRDYTFSMWIKEPNGSWCRHTETFKAKGTTANIVIPLKQKDPFVYGLQLEGLDYHNGGGVSMHMTQNSSMRFDSTDTPFNTNAPIRHYHKIRGTV